MGCRKKGVKKKEVDAERKKNKRADDKEKLSKAIKKYPDLKEHFDLKDVTGRPRLETEQPGLLQAIIDISTSGSAVDARRRTESTLFFIHI